MSPMESGEILRGSLECGNLSSFPALRAASRRKLMLSSGLPARGKIEIGAVGTGGLHRKNSFMKALVYVGLSQKALQERPKPVLVSPTDAIVRMMKSTICGTDLHILKGHVPTCRPGRILGQEGVGVIEEDGLQRHVVSEGRPGSDLLRDGLRKM